MPGTEIEEKFFMPTHEPAPTTSLWRRRIATTAQRLSLACEVAALVSGEGPTEVVARGCAVGLRVIACLLDRPTGRDHSGQSAG
ncbi:hypothetical protein V6U89_26560 [Micromonospora sp. CPCC 206171]|uniref:hypothetical protein n=1 Tax=Micromonospora sp. CPCC 206171 TaxID=3122405 RepID=UPI002FEED29F